MFTSVCVYSRLRVDGALMDNFNSRLLFEIFINPALSLLPKFTKKTN